MARLTFIFSDIIRILYTDLYIETHNTWARKLWAFSSSRWSSQEYSVMQLNQKRNSWSADGYIVSGYRVFNDTPSCYERRDLKWATVRENNWVKYVMPKKTNICKILHIVSPTRGGCCMLVMRYVSYCDNTKNWDKLEASIKMPDILSMRPPYMRAQWQSSSIIVLCWSMWHFRAKGAIY